jgi:hypothetical protein
MVYGFPAVCRWREPIVLRILGRNQWLTIPEVHYPDTSLDVGQALIILLRCHDLTLQGGCEGDVEQ